MEELMGRYRVFMKRFELEDFQAKLTVEQLRTLSQFGITPEQMFDQITPLGG